MFQARLNPKHRVKAGIGVTDAIRLEGQQVGMSGEPGESRGILNDECKGGLIAPGSLEPEARHPEHDESG